MKILISFFILILITKHSYNQTKNYEFKHFGTRNGLAGEEVTGFAQDPQGFIWLTTDNGLQRFDGENFVTYRHNNWAGDALYGDEAFNPLFDKVNNLWLYYPKLGINIFNINTAKAIKIALDDNSKGKEEEVFISYCKDAEDMMWLCSRKSLYQYNYENKTANKIGSFPDSLIADNMLAMACDKTTGDIWIGTKVGLIEYNRKQHIFFDYRYNPEHASILNIKSEPYHIYIDSRNNLWCSTWAGKLFRYGLRSHILKQYNFKKSPKLNRNSMARGIVEDRTGNLWVVANSSDVLLYNAEKDALQLVSKHFIERPSSAQTNITSMFCDRENNIWIATGFGSYFFNPAKQNIYTVTNDPFDPSSLPASQVETLGESKDGLIWVSSRDGGGVSVFDRQMKLVKHLFNNTKKVKNKIFGLSVSAFCNDRKGKLWMAAYNTLMSYDPKLKTINTFSAPELNFFVHSMICDDKNNIWIACNNTIVKLVPKTGLKTKFTSFSKNYLNNPAEITDLLVDRHSNIWVATLGAGLFHFNKLTGKFDASFVHDENNIHSLCHNNCICLAQLNDSEILVGTANGISIFNLNTKQCNNLFNNDGMLSNTIQGITADKFGNIFTSTVNGLYEINKLTHAFIHYDNEDGILDNQFYSKVFTIDDGRIMMGGLNSFIYFNPESINETFTPPDVRITGYKVLNQYFSADSISSLQLSYDKNFITFEYASLYYYSPSKIHYYYKLDGIDHDWVDAGNKKNAVYTGLDDGNYTFLVKCVNNLGIGSRNISKLAFKITPPFYKSKWFILLCVASLISLSYVLYDSRKSSRKALEKVRNAIASDLHDDIGSTLNSISVYSEVAGQQVETNSEAAKIILHKMGSASRSMIDRMNDIVWAINPNNDEFDKILQRMQYFAAELLPAKNILLHFDADDHVQHLKLQMNKRKNFYLIYKEAINNTYKYAESKNVSVSIAERHGKLTMTIIDDGKGFEMSNNTSTGNGLKNMKIRAKEINATFEMTSWPGKGTRVNLEIEV